LLPFRHIFLSVRRGDFLSDFIPMSIFCLVEKLFLVAIAEIESRSVWGFCFGSCSASLRAKYDHFIPNYSTFTMCDYAILSVQF
jgi:hypothetical protein